MSLLFTDSSARSSHSRHPCFIFPPPLVFSCPGLFSLDRLLAPFYVLKTFIRCLRDPPPRCQCFAIHGIFLFFTTVTMRYLFRRGALVGAVGRSFSFAAPEFSPHVRQMVRSIRISSGVLTSPVFTLFLLPPRERLYRPAQEFAWFCFL